MREPIQALAFTPPTQFQAALPREEEQSQLIPPTQFQALPRPNEQSQFIQPTQFQATFNYLERLQTSVSQTPLSSFNKLLIIQLQLCQRDNRFKI